MNKILENNPLVLLKVYLFSNSYNHSLRVNPGPNPCGEIGPGWRWYFDEIICESQAWLAKCNVPGTPFKEWLYINVYL